MVSGITDLFYSSSSGAWEPAGEFFLAEEDEEILWLSNLLGVTGKLNYHALGVVFRFFGKIT